MDPPVKPTVRRESLLRHQAGTAIAIALVALAIHGVFGPHGLLAMHRTKQEVERLQLEIKQLNEENRQLSEQVKALESDPATIERIAREEMGLVRPGELIFKLPPKSTETVPTAGTAAPPKPTSPRP
jgi:cell division protein FtsB